MEICPLPSGLATLPAPVHFLLCGTFNSLFLYLLAFAPATAELSISRRVQAQGPHQFLATDKTRETVYATTWAPTAALSAWRVVKGGEGGVEWINTVPITSTSSYIQVSTDDQYIYSAGGPTGEVHRVDIASKGFGQKVQQVLFVEPEELEGADKTRVALRYGSHGIDLNLPTNQAFVPHLGHNSIFIYSVNVDGYLELVADHPSFSSTGSDIADGPRHVVPSRDGRLLYVVTEHTSFVDVYSIHTASLRHLQRVSIIPPDSSARLAYRGDTLRLSTPSDSSSAYLYATTRGKTSATKGIVSVWSIGEDGMLGETALARYKTRNSGGKANAIEVFPFARRDSDAEWFVLTDDEAGWVSILEWDGRTMVEVAEVQLGTESDGEGVGNVGASHAVWLS